MLIFKNACDCFCPKYRAEDFLRWEGDWELWDGVAVSMSPSPAFRHQKLLTRLLHLFQTQLTQDDVYEEKCSAVAESDWHVSGFSVVRPDGMIVSREPEGQWVEDAPELIIEALSPSTRNKDQTVKRDLDAAEGLGYYVIDDPENGTVTVLKHTDDGAYREIFKEEAIELHEGCVLKVDEAVLFA